MESNVSADQKKSIEKTNDRAPQSAEKKTLGKYRIEKKIGAGGMGTVFLATDTELERTVALKVLPRQRASNPTLVKRFKAEAQAAARLAHENIVTIYETGQSDGYLYLALEYVDGTDVHSLLVEKKKLPTKQATDIVKQITLALEHASSQNIVHRDIKPSNLLISSEGIVKLTDLGLARCIDESTESNITRAGFTVGTVDYMSPEQARDSKAADVRSDIYSLGCTWYQMLTGQLPYPAASLTNKLAAHATQPIPNPRKKDPAIPEAVVQVLQKMMSKSPKNRYQSPTALLKDLKDPYLFAPPTAETQKNSPSKKSSESTEPKKKAQQTTESTRYPTKKQSSSVVLKKKRRRISDDRIQKVGVSKKNFDSGFLIVLLCGLLAICFWLGHTYLPQDIFGTKTSAQTDSQNIPAKPIEPL